ncbi:Probable RNA-directed DNA polymerase from transposon X-element [Eumeta japonica]|uniref:Probable RNA-directed DNA polymerase from transposon X-element n=1 Tax=Eumeta variegata TaxID=151549 RepID=A0A4C1YRJ4_EUMVA|nr:Probable RNA-directed DNA polymerase from transposon X-element [Eumeta japonica]
MVAMTRLFNGILRTGHFPVCQKIGCVIAIPKAGKDTRLASSQRPITLLSHIAKLFERIMLRRLHRHLTPRQEQFGFRSGHSTTLQLSFVLHHMAALEIIGATDGDCDYREGSGVMGKLEWATGTLTHWTKVNSYFLRRCPNAETLSRHESPDCEAKRGITHAQ